MWETWYFCALSWVRVPCPSLTQHSTVDERYWASFKWKSIFSFLFAFCSVSLRLLIIISNSSSQKRIIKLVNSTPLSQLGPWFTFHIFNIFLLFISTRYRTTVVRRQPEKNPPLRAQGPCSVKCNFSHKCRLTSYVIRDECGIFLNGFMKLS